MNGSRAGYYISRLKRASLPELLYRVVEAVSIRKAMRSVRAGKQLYVMPAVSEEEIAALRLPEMVFQGCSDQIQKIVDGERYTLNAEEIEDRSFESEWRDRFYSDIVPGVDQDIKFVWEPARMQHIPALLACLNRSEVSSPCPATVRDIVRKEIFEWLDSNPFLFGPHYMSPMECGLRIPVFFYCLKCLDDLTDTDRVRLLTSIYEHTWLVFKRLSLYSSLGNHTIAECIGLVFGGAVFRNSGEGRQWLQKGSGMLKQELYHQVLNDGGPAEQSLSYHRFVLDLYWLAVDFLETNGLADCGPWKQKLVEGERFLEAFRDRSGNYPSIGDCDDGHAIAPGVYPRRGGKDLAETRPFITFPESGYTVIRGENGMLLTFDHGPLGMAPLYNHGHADALSVTLSVAGEQVIVDPGTFRYNGVPEWRRYFKGTRAHNTVTVDGEDQAVQETGFIWSHPYRARLIQISEVEGGARIEATHDGYKRFHGSVIHRRVVGFYPDSFFLIKDSFSGRGRHNFELNFHIHPDSELEWNGRCSLIRKGAAEISIMPLGGKKFRMVFGEETPPFGWCSPAYGLKVKSPVLSCKISGEPEHVSFTTAICLGSNMPDDEYLEETACHM